MKRYQAAWCFEELGVSCTLQEESSAHRLQGTESLVGWQGGGDLLGTVDFEVRWHTLGGGGTLCS